MRLSLVKCHGSGNDFPLIDARTVRFDDDVWSAVAQALAGRTGPVGGDGLLALTPADRDHGFGMRMWNSDGSEAELCLNGLRCVARLGFERDGVEEGGDPLQGIDGAGEPRPDLAPGVYTVREVAGPAMLDVTGWPMNIGAVELVEQALPRLGSARRFTAVAMPNPHLVAFVDAIDERELVQVGEAAQDAAAWMPNRANVSFVELREGGLYVRTFERGVGLTDSCGSAMAASVYAACLTGRAAYDKQLTIWNKGGLVRGEAEVGGEVTIDGNATWEWAGSVDVDPATGAVSDVRVEQRCEDEANAWSQLVAHAAPPPLRGGGGASGGGDGAGDRAPEIETAPVTPSSGGGAVSWDSFTISAQQEG